MEQTLTHSEWYVMDCLWQHSPSTVMELVTALQAASYTPVWPTMSQLAKFRMMTS